MEGADQAAREAIPNVQGMWLPLEGKLWWKPSQDNAEYQAVAVLPSETTLPYYPDSPPPAHDGSNSKLIFQKGAPLPGYESSINWWAIWTQRMGEELGRIFTDEHSVNIESFSRTGLVAICQGHIWARPAEGRMWGDKLGSAWIWITSLADVTQTTIQGDPHSTSSVADSADTTEPPNPPARPRVPPLDLTGQAGMATQKVNFLPVRGGPSIALTKQPFDYCADTWVDTGSAGQPPRKLGTHSAYSLMAAEVDVQVWTALGDGTVVTQPNDLTRELYGRLGRNTVPTGMDHPPGLSHALTTLRNDEPNSWITSYRGCYTVNTRPDPVQVLHILIREGIRGEPGELWSKVWRMTFQAFARERGTTHPTSTEWHPRFPSRLRTRATTGLPSVDNHMDATSFSRN